MTTPAVIHLEGLRGFGYHGVLADERRDGQPFVVDLAVELDLSAAAASDDLADTVDYAAVAAAVIEIVEGEPCNLIESLADRIARGAMADGRIQRVVVTVHKPEAPVGVPFRDVSVTLERSR